jgi:hypothetical protein
MRTRWSDDNFNRESKIRFFGVLRILAIANETVVRDVMALAYRAFGGKYGVEIARLPFRVVVSLGRGPTGV